MSSRTETEVRNITYQTPFLSSEKPTHTNKLKIKVKMHSTKRSIELLQIFTKKTPGQNCVKYPLLRIKLLYKIKSYDQKVVSIIWRVL